MRTGTGSNLRYVDLTKIETKLGESNYKSLPRFHAITGCDYNAFFRKVKSRPCKILTKTEDWQNAFINFAESELFENSDKQLKYDVYASLNFL